jgi:hypothetical protein
MKPKKLSVFSLLFLVFLALPVEAQKVSIDVSMPEKGVAGQKIPVKVTIRKGDYSDFARFRQVLPNGFSVEPVETSNSDFTMKNGELNFIWLKLPQENVVTLEYELLPDEHLRGVYQITGLFSYISDQERQELTVPEKTITIEPAPAGETAPAAAATTQAAAVTRNLEVPAGPAAYRGQPVKVGKDWIVRLIINRGSLEKLGKLEETIPPGYLPENINGNGAIFSYREGEIKYIWMNFPEDSVFEVSYKLVPLEGTPAEAVPQLSGVFSYMQDDVSKRLPVQMLEGEVPADAEESVLYALTATAAAPAVTSAAQESKPAAPPVQETAVQETSPPPVPETVTPASENKPGQPTEIVEHAPQKSEGIYFRVQLLATARPVEMEAYFRKHNVPGKIYKEYINGLYKYTTGSFTSYREARDFVQRLKETTDINEAFVTAYDNGRRISVREALDRTGQKWFK